MRVSAALSYGMHNWLIIIATVNGKLLYYVAKGSYQSQPKSC